jgi:hypothetical protein
LLSLLYVVLAIRGPLQNLLPAAALPEVAPYRSPLHLGVGVGVKGGCEAIIHAVASIFEDPSHPAYSKLILQLDFDNAFNAIDRETLFREVFQKKFFRRSFSEEVF